MPPAGGVQSTAAGRSRVAGVGEARLVAAVGLARRPAAGVARVVDRAPAGQRRPSRSAPSRVPVERRRVRRAGRREPLEAVGGVEGQRVPAAAGQRRPRRGCRPRRSRSRARARRALRSSVARPVGVAVELGAPALRVDAGDQPVRGVVLERPRVRRPAARLVRPRRVARDHAAAPARARARRGSAGPGRRPAPSACGPPASWSSSGRRRGRSCRVVVRPLVVVASRRASRS